MPEAGLGFVEPQLATLVDTVPREVRREDPLTPTSVALRLTR